MEDLLLPYKLPPFATLFKFNKLLLIIQHDSIKVTSNWKLGLNSKSQNLVHTCMRESVCACVCAHACLCLHLPYRLHFLSCSNLAYFLCLLETSKLMWSPYPLYHLQVFHRGKKSGFREHYTVCVCVCVCVCPTLSFWTKQQLFTKHGKNISHWRQQEAQTFKLIQSVTTWPTYKFVRCDWQWCHTNYFPEIMFGVKSLSWKQLHVQQWQYTLKRAAISLFT